jgi:predicted pyridoxine 5'-phosphate oxidase superfamily flavin-nucleotide-binding protein
MPHRYTEIAFTENVRAAQQRYRSRDHALRMEARAMARELGPREREFIAERDSFYLATVNQHGWPYVQHRGGQAGFLKVLDAHTLGFPDFRGNLQYVTAGNLAADDRVSLILVDYARRRRLKLFGRARNIDLAEAAPDVARRLAVHDDEATTERFTLIQVEAFDWNCSQHIPYRVGAAEIAALMRPLEGRVALLEARLRAAGIEPPAAPTTPQGVRDETV